MSCCSGSLAQWLVRRTQDQNVVGSNPASTVFLSKTLNFSLPIWSCWPDSSPVECYSEPPSATKIGILGNLPCCGADLKWTFPRFFRDRLSGHVMAAWPIKSLGVCLFSACKTSRLILRRNMGVDLFNEIVLMIEEPPLRKTLWKRLAPGMHGRSYQTKPGRPSGCQVNIKCFYAKSLGSNYRNISSLTLVQKVIRGYLQTTVDINYSWAYLWLISHDLSHGVPLMLILWAIT
jgi:hypothetical protein